MLGFADKRHGWKATQSVAGPGVLEEQVVPGERAALLVQTQGPEPPHWPALRGHWGWPVHWQLAAAQGQAVASGF